MRLREGMGFFLCSLGWALTALANPTLVTTHEFPRTGRPATGVMRASDGFVYVLTSAGGRFDRGTLSRVEPGGDLRTLVTFTGTAGSSLGTNPQGVLLETAPGVLYGATAQGGSSDPAPFFATSGAC